MNWLDIILLCLAGIGFVKGLFDGFIKQVVSLIALVAAIFFCGKVAEWLKAYIVKLDWFPAEGVDILSYIIGFLLIICFLLLVGEVMHRIIDVTPLGIINHIAGGLFGLCSTLLFLSLFLNLLEVVDKRSVLVGQQTKDISRVYYPIKEIVPTIYPTRLFSL